MVKKILVLSSGGIDSTSLLHAAVKMVGAENVIALNMYYGQKHKIEIDCAHWQAEHLGVKHIDKDISVIFKGLENSSALLEGSDKEIAHESYAEQLKHTDVVSAYVPYRNGLFLSCAASIAYALGCELIAYGAHADDAVRRQNGGAAYPDCTEEFIKAQREAIEQGTGGKVGLWAPLWDKTKAGVVRFGLDNGCTRETFEHTHSCYEGVEGGCGTCGTCIDARAALDANPETKGVRQS